MQEENLDLYMKELVTDLNMEMYKVNSNQPK